MEDKPSGELLQAGTPEERAVAARVMGMARSDAKAQAARENGKKGGRPKGTPVSEETRRKISETKRQRAASKQVHVQEEPTFGKEE